MLAFNRPNTVTMTASSLARRTPYSIVDPRQFVRQLADVRRRGYSFENEETQLGVRCVAAPIHDGDGGVAAISLCSTQQLNPTAHGRLVRDAAAQISRRLGA